MQDSTIMCYTCGHAGPSGRLGSTEHAQLESLSNHIVELNQTLEDLLSNNVDLHVRLKKVERICDEQRGNLKEVSQPLLHLDGVGITSTSIHQINGLGNSSSVYAAFPSGKCRLSRYACERFDDETPTRPLLMVEVATPCHVVDNENCEFVGDTQLIAGTLSEKNNFEEYVDLSGSVTATPPVDYCGVACVEAMEPFEEDASTTHLGALKDASNSDGHEAPQHSHQCDAVKHLPHGVVDGVALDALMGHTKHGLTFPFRELSFGLNDLLGRGAFARVYLGACPGRSAPVAIKITEHVFTPLSKLNVERARFESEVLSRICHPNVVALHGFAEKANQFATVLEVMSCSLRDRMRTEGGKLQVEESRLTFKDVVRGLAHVHSLGIAHRDLKPANILLNSDGVAKLADFGICSCERVAREGLGSKAYSAPELYDLRQPRYDVFPADIWSAGALLHAMVCGRSHPLESAIPPLPCAFEGLLLAMKLWGNTCAPQLAPVDPDGNLRTLLTKCLRWKAEERPNAAAVCGDPWLSVQLVEYEARV